MKRLFFLILLAFPILTQAQKLSTATFAAGCFWCSEEAFEKVPRGVGGLGYTDGKTKNPSYEMVSSGAPAIPSGEVKFDPSKVSYEKLLDVFWVNHDRPTPTAVLRPRLAVPAESSGTARSRNASRKHRRPSTKS